jgi:hypothetical protein
MVICHPWLPHDVRSLAVMGVLTQKYNTFKHYSKEKEKNIFQQQKKWGDKPLFTSLFN